MEGFTLDTLKIDIKGDNSGYKQTLLESQNETRKAADNLKVAMGGAIDDISTRSRTAGQQLRSVSDSVKGYGNSVASFGGNLASLPFSAVSSGLSAVTGAISSFGMSLLSLPFTSISTSFQGMISTFIKGIQDIEQLDIKSKRLGTDINELRVAMTWGGAASSSIPQAISNVNRAISQSQIGGIRQTSDLSSLARISGSNTQAGSFTDVVSQLSKIEDSGVRAAHAFRLMGDSATDFLDVLAKPQGLQEAKSLVKRFGLEVSDVDLANARAVGQTMREIQMIWDGFKNQVILAIAPFARALSEAFDPKNVDLTWIKDTIFAIGRAVLGMSAFFIEAARDSNLLWEGMQAGLKVASAGFLQFKAIAVEALGGIAQTFTKVFNNIINEQIKKLADIAGAGGLINPLITDLIKATKPVNFKVDIGEFRKAADEARRLSKVEISEAKKQIIEIGVKVKDRDAGRFMDELIKKAERFANETGKGIDNLNKTERQIKNMNDLFAKTMSGEFESLRRGISLPGRSFVQDMQKIFTLQGIRNFVRDPTGGEGFYRTPFGNIARRRGETRPDFFEGMKGLEEQIAFRSYQQLLNDVRMNTIPQLSSAAMFRSQEAVSAELKFQVQSERPDVQEQIKQALELANKQREMQQEIGRKTLDALIKLREELKKLTGFLT